MKRIVFLVLIVIAVTATAAAQQAAVQQYTVQSVTGRVQQAAGNSRIDIAVGDILSADTVIHTGIGAAMVLRAGERTINIPAAQNGRRLADLVAGGSGIRIGGNVAHTDTGAVSRTMAQVSTASARASDAAEGDDIAAE